MEDERKWSPNEAKVLAFAKDKHGEQTRIGGEPYINHPKRVAQYLYDLRYRGKYTFTAFCHDLLEDTDTTEEEILDIGGRLVRDAVVLLTKHEGVGIADYLEKIKYNEVSYIVKVADRIDNLRDAVNADLGFIQKYLVETEDYYLDFAEDSPFFEDLLYAYSSLGEHYDKENYNYEKKKLFVVEVEGAYKGVKGKEYLNILDGFFYSEKSDDYFPIACILSKDEIELAETRSGMKLAIRFTATPTSEIEIYKDEEVYYKENPHGFASRSFVPSWLLIENEDLEIPDPSACFTGFVKRVYTPSQNEKTDENVNNYIVDVDTLGIIISLDLGENPDNIPAVGNIISGVYRIYGSVNKGDQDLQEDIQEKSEASNIVTKYWVSGSGDEPKSALKVISSPKDIKFIHYNSVRKEGKEVEGENFYEISVGMNFDYDTISEEGFLDFIKTL